jgi:hypothetical protein
MILCVFGVYVTSGADETDEAVCKEHESDKAYPEAFTIDETLRGAGNDAEALLFPNDKPVTHNAESNNAAHNVSCAPQKPSSRRVVRAHP